MRRRSAARFVQDRVVCKLCARKELSGETALTRAADRGQSAIVRIILSRGTPGFQKLLAQRCRSGPQGDGATALHLAAGRGFLSICDRLLGVGADPSATDRAGRMPLHAAAEADRVEVANLLLTFGSLHSGQDRVSGAHVRGCAHMQAFEKPSP